MKQILTLVLFAATLAVSGTPATTVQAQDIEIQLGRDGPNVRMRDRCDPRYENCRRDDRNWRGDRRDDRRARRDEGARWRDQCTPDRALAKAERMGIRRARILDVGRRTVDVRGRSRGGDRVVISFGRWDRGCPIYR